MKLLLILLSALIGIFALLFSYDPSRFTQLEHIFYYKPCDTPKQYYFGIIDARFELPFPEFKNYVNQAANIWDNAYGEKLFQYNPTLGNLEINLYYDRKKDLDSQIAWLQNAIVTDGSTIVDDSTMQKKSMYQGEFNQFIDEVEKFDDQLDAWKNQQGNITYSQLVEEQLIIKEEEERLNTLAESLDLPTSTYNEYIDELNQVMQEKLENVLIDPEEGVYLPYTHTIDIYFYATPQEIVHTITHEMGHALGLPHNSNPNSIMYYKSSDTLTPTAEDIAALKEACKPKTFFDRIKSDFK